MKKILLILMSLSSFIWAAEITFTFANVTFTGDSPSYFEFDVLAQADVAGTLLGDNLIYVNYNELGFGSSVAANGKITVTKDSLLFGDFGPPAPFYTIENVTDNSASRFAITVVYNYEDYPQYGNEVPTYPKKLMHIKLEIADDSQTAGLSFEQSLMVGQEYESDNTTKYSPVVASDTENSILSPSALEEVPEFGIPKKFALKQNYPNPFNPSTTLRFDVPEVTDMVTLTVYDVLGREVISLYEGSAQPGVYNYTWDGKNNVGHAMPTGVYFAILKAPEFSHTIKMMLIK